ncbi:MAG TPA: sugar transferase [Actinomycetota bacterium]|nr:sugar transferase [Actinomycetota bacterium]
MSVSEIDPAFGAGVATPVDQSAAAPRPVVEPLEMSWAGKRAFDLVFGTVLLALFTPLMLLVAFAVFFDTGGPIFFRQARVGRHGRTFMVFKFRSMTTDAEEQLSRSSELLGHYLAGDYKICHICDPRVTRIGKFLRRTSLDELPQLFNVLAGDMSLVGPRPVRPDELERYEDRRSFYLRLRPGMTGIWQISGRCTIKFPRRAELDEQYARRCSFGSDLAILARTPWAVVKGRGAN